MQPCQKLSAKVYDTQDATVTKSYEVAFENGLYGDIETVGFFVFT